jgi:nucleoside 2-deoxyribosyltransferase
MKIYMAGPLFSTAELAFNAELAKELRGRGHEVFLPQEHEQRKDLPAAIFESDVRGLDWAEVVVACLDGPDPDSGTCWELGYAYAKGKPSIVYRTDFRLFEGTDPINLMMTESADHLIIMKMARVADLAAEIGKRLEEISGRMG